MPKERTPLTKGRIEKATVPPGNGQFMLWDSIVSGFGVRCLPGGSKTFVFRYRPHSGGRSVNPRLLKLGAFPSISLDDARAAARIHAGNVAKGKDPAQQRAEERRRDRATLGKLLAGDGPYELHLKERGLVNIKPALSSLRRGLKAHMTADVAACPAMTSLPPSARWPRLAGAARPLICGSSRAHSANGRSSKVWRNSIRWRACARRAGPGISACRTPSRRARRWLTPSWSRSGALRRRYRIAASASPHRLAGWCNWRY